MGVVRAEEVKGEWGEGQSDPAEPCMPSLIHTQILGASQDTHKMNERKHK